jgi:hypothetical protein
MFWPLVLGWLPAIVFLDARVYFNLQLFWDAEELCSRTFRFLRW